MTEPSNSQIVTEQPAKARFARHAATLSLIAPLVAFLIDIFIHLHVHVFDIGQTVIELVLVIFGLVSGIIALIMTRQHGRKGIFGKAIAGICINGVFTLILPVIILATIFLTYGVSTTPQKKLDQAMKELAAASTQESRFYALDDAAKQSFEAGKIEDAGKYATELIALAPKFQTDWNYGNAIQDGNLVLGRIALRDGRTEEAKEFLLKSGKSRGSPQMNSFGPNVSLAKDLLEKGEKETVLQYFGLCRQFWKIGRVVSGSEGWQDSQLWCEFSLLTFGGHLGFTRGGNVKAAFSLMHKQIQILKKSRFSAISFFTIKKTARDPFAGRDAIGKLSERST